MMRAQLLQRTRRLSALARQSDLRETLCDDALSELLKPARVAPLSRTSYEMDDAFLYGKSDALAYQRQLQREQNTMDMAVERYKRMAEGALKRGDVWILRPASRLVGAWVNPVSLAIRKEQDEYNEAIKKNGNREQTKGGRTGLEWEVQRFMTDLPPEVMTVIVVNEVLGTLMRDVSGATLTSLAIAVGNAVRGEVNARKLRDLRAKQDSIEAMNSAAAQNDAPVDGSGSPVSKLARKRQSMRRAKLLKSLNSSSCMSSAVNYAAIQAQVANARWPLRDLLLLGTKLIDLLVKCAYVEEAPGKLVPAFRHDRRFQKKGVHPGVLQLSDATLKVLSQEGSDLRSFLEPKHQPMEVRPRPWISATNGGYLATDVHLIRAASSRTLDDALAAADLQTVYEGLNALGDTAWRVNTGVLCAGKTLWERGGGVAGLVSKVDVEVPSRAAFLAEEALAFAAEKQSQRSSDRTGARKGEKSEGSETEAKFDEAAALRRLKYKRRNARKINRELFAMRADTQYKLDHATIFADKERLYLPHNVDFRGRAYPIPVYLQHMGADLTRAMLTFAGPGVRLGKRGVYWLKVHLANHMGADKLSFDERIAFAESALPRAIEVGRDPLSEKNLEWWGSHEDPFQLLAACQEFANAVGRFGGSAAMEDYMSTLPVSMDGSCNGLQHYAALGLDVLGGERVNLTPSERPQDVYTGVAKLVRQRVEAAAAKGDETAQLLRDRITRKIVKQTVMTSVYGVTMTGAREQIANRLREIEFPDEKIFGASMMLAKLTLASLGDIFSGATRTMEWLSNAALAISRDGHEVQWTSAVGLPVMQPYRKKARSIVKTIMQRVTLEERGEHQPVSPARQSSAFPPNFVHSVDSAHMLLTAIACKNAGLNYAAVHDSFWTNAATVDTMNKLLREEFVKLHSRQLLIELRESFVMRYPKVDFEEVPQRGELDLRQVLESPYFFS